MKKVFPSNKKLIDKWLKQDQDFGRNQSRSLYFEKETIYSYIYSYGSQYPLAAIIDNTVLINSYSYSVTTGKQKSNVRWALVDKGFIIFEVPIVKSIMTKEDHRKNNVFYCERIDEVLLKQKKAVKRNYSRTLEQLMFKHKQYKQIFNV
jgi:hypothetical protein